MANKKKTSKEFSTICWNTEAFLIQQLEQLISLGILDHYAYIKHEPDSDESLKHHFHCFFVPSCEVEFKRIQDALTEYEKDKEPNRPATFKVSNFDDWYYYGLHDRVYLLRCKKYKHKNKRYRPNDFRFDKNGYDWFYNASHSAERPEGGKNIGGDRIRLYMAEYVKENGIIPNLYTAQKELGIMPPSSKEFYIQVYNNWNAKVNSDCETQEFDFTEWIKISPDATFDDVLKYFDE